MKIIATISMLVLIVCNFFITHTTTLILVEHLTLLLWAYLLFNIILNQYVFIKIFSLTLTLYMFTNILTYYLTFV